MKGKKMKKVVTWANVPSSLHSGINMDSWGLLACSKARVLSVRHLDWPASETRWHCVQVSCTAVFFIQDAVLHQQHSDQYNHSLLLVATTVNYCVYFTYGVLFYFTWFFAYDAPWFSHPNWLKNRPHCRYMKPRKAWGVLLLYSKNSKRKHSCTLSISNAR